MTLTFRFLEHTNFLIPILSLGAMFLGWLHKNTRVGGVSLAGPSGVLWGNPGFTRDYAWGTFPAQTLPLEEHNPDGHSCYGDQEVCRPVWERTFWNVTFSQTHLPPQTQPWESVLCLQAMQKTISNKASNEDTGLQPTSET